MAFSTDSTSIVLVVVETSPLFIRPPLIPGVPSGPVVTIQYSIGPRPLFDLPAECFFVECRGALRIVRGDFKNVRFEA